MSLCSFEIGLEKPFNDVYQKEICGTLGVETSDGNKTSSVPFVSFFAGLCVASELIKYHSKSFEEFPLMNYLDFLQVSLFSPKHLNLAHRPKNPSCSINCSDESLQECFSEKWS